MTKTDNYSLRRIYNRIKDDSTFDSFESFAQWAQGKRRTGFTVYKLREDEPHSPENSYWYYAVKPVPDTASPVCEGCEEALRVCNQQGCLKWRQWFVDNWNANICIKPKEVPEAPKTKGFFRYELPDLVRERIVWTRN